MVLYLHWLVCPRGSYATLQGNQGAGAGVCRETEAPAAAGRTSRTGVTMADRCAVEDVHSEDMRMVALREHVSIQLHSRQQRPFGVYAELLQQAETQRRSRPPGSWLSRHHVLLAEVSECALQHDLGKLHTAAGFCTHVCTQVWASMIPLR